MKRQTDVPIIPKELFLAVSSNALHFMQRRKKYSIYLFVQMNYETTTFITSVQLLTAEKDTI